MISANRITEEQPMRKRILILGASGLLGTSLTESLKEQGYELYTVSKSAKYTDFCFDITNKAEFDNVINVTKPDFILNLTAITDVDWCESNVEEAYKVHVSICNYLAYYSQKYGTKIIHISTDSLYDKKNSEEDFVSPKNVYALTKLMGEMALETSDATILRTNFFGRSKVCKRNSLTDVMYDSVKKGKRLILFEDVYFSPLSINTLCKLIDVVINNWHPGLYNLGSKNGLSKSNFILSFFEECNLTVENYEIKSIDSLDLSAKRPKDMRMNCNKFEKTYNLVLPDLINEIKCVAREYNEEGF